MDSRFERYALGDRADALDRLADELRDFGHDALQQLRDDLAAGTVLRGSWDGCVLSYRRGAPGSARRDGNGRARNAFTVLWDTGRITDAEVLDRVDIELARRATRLTDACPAISFTCSPDTGTRCSVSGL